MNDETKRTKFASPGRSSEEEVSWDQQLVAGHEFTLHALDFFPEVVMILNDHRQIVYGNEKLRELLHVGIDDLLGKRLGEAFSCIHSEEEDAGCGTSIFCRECGAAKAILASQKSNQKAEEECRLTVYRNGKEEALDLRVWVSPLDLEGKSFTMVTLKDIADEKRREQLEKTFFHDLLNNAGVLMGYFENAAEDGMELSPDMVQHMRDIAERVVAEIEGHRDLLAAETDQLATIRQEFRVLDLLRSLHSIYAHSRYADGKRLVIEGDEDSIENDRVLLGRVLGNLIKNALEATPENGAVTVSYRKDGEKHIFSVSNPGVISEDVKLQIFQRSFSTKGSGRGIGTYSVKLLTENYLGGSVWFESSPEHQTIFTVVL